MKVLHITNVGVGGAGIAAYRLHTALRKAGINSQMLVRRTFRDELDVEEIQPQFMVRLRGWLGARLAKLIGKKDCSFNIFPTGLHKILNSSDADIIHFHWINNEMISIGEIAKIRKPLVWTLHDCWPLLGAEHHSSADYWRRSEDRGQRSEDRSQMSDDDFNDFNSQRDEGCRFTDENPGHIKHEKTKKAPSTSNQQPAKSGTLYYVVNQWVFRRKQKAWRNLKVHFIAPSRWMAEQVRRSQLFADAPVEVIPNGVDLDIFKPMDRAECRRKFKLPQEKKLILFGAHDPLDPNKGLDLMEKALLQFPEENKKGVGVVVFGCKKDWKISGLETYWMGPIAGEQEMAGLYNVADVTCVPSRRESFGQTVSESLACGVPVAAFRTSGLVDVVQHKQTGWLATPFDAKDFSKGICWALGKSKGSDTGSQMSEVCREKAKTQFSLSVVAESHLASYRSLVTNNR